MTLQQILSLLRDAQCRQLIVKWLAPNDNSKNQIYFGPDFQSVNLLPHGDVVADGSRFKAPLDLEWLDDHGNRAPAPSAQLILYPQYPEVRFSGFLKGSPNAPSELLRSRGSGRVLLLGIGQGPKIVGYVGAGNSPLARELEGQISEARDLRMGVFHELQIAPDREDPTQTLLSALGSVHKQGWVDGQRLRADGVITRTDAPNACGYTLESLLGVSANSAAGPDFLGWELKSLTVKKLGTFPASHRITLMTPEPKGGVYRDEGVLEFVRRYGYPDRNGIADRMNFGGQFRVGKREPNTGLTMCLDGYSAEPGEVTGRIEDPSGGLVLSDDQGEIAAKWPYTELISHWNRKHARAAFLPAVSRTETGRREFRFDRQVFLGVQTDFLRFLGSMNLGNIVYDPGIKVEQNSGPSPITKRRSQFRTKFADLNVLYAKFGVHPLDAYVSES